MRTILLLTCFFIATVHSIGQADCDCCPRDTLYHDCWPSIKFEELSEEIVNFEGFIDAIKAENNLKLKRYNAFYSMAYDSYLFQKSNPVKLSPEIHRNIRVLAGDKAKNTDLFLFENSNSNLKAFRWNGSEATELKLTKH